MKLFKFLAACLLTLAGAVFAESSSAEAVQSGTPSNSSPLVSSSVVRPSSGADSAFSHVYVSAEIGEIYPWGDLIDVVENSVYAGFGIRYTYWKNFDGILLFDYTYFKMRMNEVPYPGVHQFMGRLGLDWRSKWLSPIILGGGFICNWTRADDGEEQNFNAPGGTLIDNETEFGYFVRINVPFLKYNRVVVGLNVLWEELWTLPERSNMLSAGFYAEWRLW